MTIWEYMKAVDDLHNWHALPQEHKLLDKSLRQYINATVTVEAHAWCMDVENERRKMSQVIFEIFEEVLRNC